MRLHLYTLCTVTFLVNINVEYVFVDWVVMSGPRAISNCSRSTYIAHTNARTHARIHTHTQFFFLYNVWFYFFVNAISVALAPVVGISSAKLIS